MPKHTISLEKEDMRVIKVIQAIHDIKNIPDAVSYIIRDYGKTEAYTKFIKDKRWKRWIRANLKIFLINI